MKQVKTKLSKEDKNFIWRSYNKLQSSEFEKRIYDDDGVSSPKDRPEYSRDYARILYSSSFRRLQGKMQILGVESTAFYRNRLTHSLEVAQIAKSIARVLSKACGVEKGNRKWMYQDQELCLLEAAALAHDIGHPAFGHKGERVLDEIAREYGFYFEGNAQNYRVLNLLDRHGSSCQGLNLTYRTLLAINKYIVKEDAKVEKFMFVDDYECLMDFRKKNDIEKERTLDVQIIELADDIAYTVHDLEDALSLNLCTINDILFELDKKNKEAYNLFVKIINATYENMGCSCKIGNIQENSHLFRKALISILTNLFVRKLSVQVVSKDDCIKYGISENTKELTLETSYKLLCKYLKKIIFECAITKSDIALYEAKGEIVIKSLFNIYSKEKINKKYNLLPPDYRPKTDEEAPRKVIDYIAGMMDTFAISEFEKLTGKDFNTMDISNTPTIYVPQTQNNNSTNYKLYYARIRQRLAMPSRKVSGNWLKSVR